MRGSAGCVRGPSRADREQRRPDARAGGARRGAAARAAAAIGAAAIRLLQLWASSKLGAAIGSDLACHIPLLKKVGHLGKPIILSTGMTTLEEVRDSVNAIFETGNKKLILLHCISDYPTKIEETNLSAINTLKKVFSQQLLFNNVVTK